MSHSDKPIHAFRQFYPDSGAIDWGHINDGMTLREYYAGQAGPIFLQKALSAASLQNNGIVDDLIARGIKVSARDAVRWADALIAELEGGDVGNA